MSMDPKKISKYKDEFRNFISSKKNYIRAGVGLAKSITAFATNKSPLSFVEGGFNILESISSLGNTTSWEYFSQERGWQILAGQSWKDRPMFDIYSSLLINYPFSVVDYGGTITNLKSADKIFQCPIGLIGTTEYYLYFKSDKTKEEISTWLLDKKIEELGSKFYSLSITTEKTDMWARTSTYGLIADQPRAIASTKSEYYTKYIRSYLDKGINRSIVFLGSSGTGKSTIIDTILKNLDLSSFRFSYNNLDIDLNLIKSILTSLKVEALIIDDFEQAYNGPFLLEFLEWANRNIKVVLASSNSLKDVHPAIIRPGRFCEIVSINEIDEELLKTLLGERFSIIGDKVKAWPIAYINELLTRLNARDDLDQDMIIKELDERVIKALALLKG